MDGDGLVDIVGKGLSSSTGLTDTVMFMRGHGDGTFDLAIPGMAILAPMTGPVTAADLDGDGDIDLAYGNGLSWSVQVLVNDGQGVFSFGEETLLPNVGLLSLDLKTGDFDGDGLPDVVATSMTSAGVRDIWLLTGDGAGGFASLSTALNTMPSITLGGGVVTDANDDGRDDFVLTHSSHDALSLFFGSPDAFVDVGYGSGPARLSAAVSTAAGDLISLQVTGVPTGTAGFVALSLVASATPLAGGTLLPASPLLVPVVAASPLRARWPATLLDGMPIYVQGLIPGDPPSNALALVDGTEP